MIAALTPRTSLLGASGSVRAPMVELQRARLIAAAGQVACEHGFASLTVASIVERAGASRRTFYEIFTDSEDCAVSTLEDAFERAQARALPVWRSEAGWRERVRGSLIELLCLFEEEPILARLLLVESLGAGSGVLERRARVIEALVSAVYEGARPAGDPEAVRLAVEGAVGGVLGVLHSRVSQQSGESLLGLAGSLMSMLVLPCQGAAAARRELDRPLRLAEKPRGAGETPFRSDPFKDAGMRVTYRTIRALAAIAQRPGASNRQIGGLAEMSDQGQISKLLSRLERIGVIANSSECQPGEANAWALTPAGRQVIARIGAHTGTVSS